MAWWWLPEPENELPASKSCPAKAKVANFLFGVMLKGPTLHVGQLASNPQPCPHYACPAAGGLVTLHSRPMEPEYSKCLINAEKQKRWADLCLHPVGPVHPHPVTRPQCGLMRYLEAEGTFCCV